MPRKMTVGTDTISSRHRSPRPFVAAEVMIRYEDLRAAPRDCVSYICDSLGIEVDSEQLGQAVERRAFERIPQEHRGQGKFHRKATPGGWREDLTPAQVRVVEEITGPLLREFYPDSIQ